MTRHLEELPFDDHRPVSSELCSRDRVLIGSVRRNMMSLGSAVTLTLAGLTPLASADDRFVRELEAFCVSAAGMKRAVVASQDGATLAYVQSSGQPVVMVRTIHNRWRVSAWHRSLDEAGFDGMAPSEVAAPYCGIDRTDASGRHKVRWPLQQTPVHLKPTFDAMMSLH